VLRLSLEFNTLYALINSIKPLLFFVRHGQFGDWLLLSLINPSCPRDVWQTEKAFGYDNIAADEERKLLREIFLTSNMESQCPMDVKPFALQCIWLP
jgi:hypothetical protein